jgi:hypothetical protein
VLSFADPIEAVLVEPLPSQAPLKLLGRTLHPAAKSNIRTAAARVKTVSDKVRIETL